MSPSFIVGWVMAKLTQKSSVSRSNELVRAKLTISTLHQKRLLYSVMSAINPCVDVLDGGTDEQIVRHYEIHPDERIFCFNFREYTNFWQLGKRRKIRDKQLSSDEIEVGGEGNKGLAKEMELACEQVVKATLNAVVNGKPRVVNAIEYAEYSGEQISLKLTATIMPYMVNLHQRMMGYTSIPLLYMVDFKSQYSFKLLEVLLSYYSRGSRSAEIEISTLRGIFDCEKKHSLYGDFKRSVLDVAVKEVQEITADKVKIEYQGVMSGTGGRGRPRVIAVRFDFDFPNYRAAREASKKSPAVRGDTSVYGGPSKRMLELKAEVEKLTAAG